MYGVPGGLQSYNAPPPLPAGGLSNCMLSRPLAKKKSGPAWGPGHSYPGLYDGMCVGFFFLEFWCCHVCEGF